MNAEFRPAHEAPENVPVVATIEYSKRDIRARWLKRCGAVWWLPDDSAYTFVKPRYYLHITKST